MQVICFRMIVMSCIPAHCIQRPHCGMKECQGPFWNTKLWLCWHRKGTAKKLFAVLFDSKPVSFGQGAKADVDKAGEKSTANLRGKLQYMLRGEKGRQTFCPQAWEREDSHHLHELTTLGLRNMADYVSSLEKQIIWELQHSWITDIKAPQTFIK